MGKKSKKVLAEYFNLVKKYSEFKILIDLPENKLKDITQAEIVANIINVREGRVKIEPGYDGLYGKISIQKNYHKPQQNKLF